MKKFFLFDLDGVILNSMPYHTKAMQQACFISEINISEEIILNNEGAITYELLKEIAKNSNVFLTKEKYFEIINNHKKIFIEKYAKEVKPYYGILELFYKLKSYDKKLAIITGSDKDIVDVDLPKEISNLVDVIITADKIQYRKPHPQPYQKALELLGAKKEESLAVENSPTGILSAKNAGLYCIAIATTLPKEKLSLADVVLGNHSELANYILNVHI